MTLALACRPDTPPDKAPDTPESDSGSDSADTGTPDTAPPDTGDPPDTSDSGDSADPCPGDADCDGHDATVDCDDDDPTVYPGAREICSDGVVNDCHGDTGTAMERCTSPVSTADATALWELGYIYPDHVKAAGVGDLNGDGLDDVVLGHPILSPLSEEDGWELFAAGGAYVYYGPFEGGYVWGDEDQAIVGDRSLARLGWDVVGMGDTDGDGYDDFAVARSNNIVAGPTVYRVDGPAQIGSISEATALVEHTASYDCAGGTLATVSDRDGDGSPDLLVGDHCADTVHLISGGVTEAGALGTDDLATFVSEGWCSRLGRGMAEGDFDGDGLGDVALGAPQYSGDCSDTIRLGYVTAFLGDVAGTVSDGDADSTIRAVASDSEPWAGYYTVMLGHAVAASDLDGDGYDDLIAGAPWRNDDTVAEAGGWGFIEGALLVYHGPLATEAGIPDADFAFTGDEDNATVGGETTADQDLDGDGHPDLLVGNGWAEWNGTYEGGTGGNSRAWILYGPISTGTRLASTADVILQEDADVTPRSWGRFARVAGDTNGDGRKEVLVSDSGTWIGLFELPTGAY